MEGGQDMEVEVLNDVGAKAGDRIMLGIESTTLLKVSFLLYIFPVLLMLGGAAIGQHIALSNDMDVAGLSVLFGFLSFLIAFYLIRLRGKKMARNQAYQPRIIKILRP
jgi:sigma-E factor negative regulatory protein RseC